MVTVEIYQDDSGQIQGFVVQGHSGFRPRGEDVVCAGVSILTQTTALGLYKHLTVPPEIERESGFLKCHLPKELPEEEMEKAQVLLQTMLLGLESMEPSYSKYIIIHKRRWM